MIGLQKPQYYMDGDTLSQLGVQNMHYVICNVFSVLGKFVVRKYQDSRLGLLIIKLCPRLSFHFLALHFWRAVAVVELLNSIYAFLEMLARYGRRLFFWRRIADNNILDTAARDSIENNFIESLVSDQKYLSSSDSDPSMVDDWVLPQGNIYYWIAQWSVMWNGNWSKNMMTWIMINNIYYYYHFETHHAYRNVLGQKRTNSKE